MLTENLEDLITRVRNDSGCTVDIMTGQHLTRGFVVAAEGYSLIIPYNTFFSNAGVGIIAQYINENFYALLPRGRSLGLWDDKAECSIVVDVVDHISSLVEVLHLGSQRKQKAVYDVTGQMALSLVETKEYL